MRKNSLSFEANDGSCCFCKEFGKAQSECSDMNNSRILFENEFAVSFISAGPLTEGHMLVAPREHWTCTARLPREIYSQLQNVREATVKWLKKTYELPVIEFEHGVIGTQAGGCGIDHAHIHLMPWPKSSRLLDILPQETVNNAITTISFPNYDVSEPYLFIKDSDGNKKVLRLLNLPSQYMRQQLSTHLSNKDWDWKKKPINIYFERTFLKLNKWRKYA
jgi:ATP adenylyltransferase